jgi:hypothetical protein
MQNSPGATTKKQLDGTVSAKCNTAFPKNFLQALAAQQLAIHEDAITVKDDQIRFWKAGSHSCI